MKNLNRIKCAVVSISTVSLLGLVSTISRASEDRPPSLEDGPAQKSFEIESRSLGFVTPVGSLETFRSTQAVLEHLKIAPEPSYQNEVQEFDLRQSEAGAKALLPFLDPKGQFKNFSGVASGPTPVLQGFQDIISKQVSDFTVKLAQSPNADGPLNHLSGTVQKPLLGLRVALDPGHMGGTIWDVRTGKFVKDGHGNTVSEGVINLQTSLLLKQRLENLGATVFVTHETLGPVETQITWESLNPNDFAPEKILSETLKPWFVSLINSAPIGDSLFRAFDSSSAIKKAHSDSMRWEYFVLHADLEARVKLIEQFNPHMTIIIHYDTGGPSFSSAVDFSGGHDATKVYIGGGYSPEEFATRKQRKNFVEHITDPYAWSTSFNLSKSILYSMKKGLGLPGDRGADGTTVVIEPGLQARNLHLTGSLQKMAVSYVECLFYSQPNEFAAFLKKDYTMQIGNVQTTYSNRLVQVVDSLEQGIVNFVKSPTVVLP